MFDLSNRVAVVCGASSGLGVQFAHALSGQGAKVALLARRAEKLEKIASELGAKGCEALAVPCDITNENEVKKAVDAVMGRFGRVDILVNNAGRNKRVPFENFSTEDWNAVIDVHLNGTFNVSKAATPYFREQQSGSFIHFTSTSGLIGNIGQANYSAAKLGIVGLSQSIALDMARAGVRSNCIAPFAWSRMTASIPAETPEQKQRVERLKTMSADKIAPLVVYLASDASQEVTNQIFSVRKNEIVLYNKPRPIRSMTKLEGWTPESIADELIPAFKPSFARADEVSAHVFPYDPI